MYVHTYRRRGEWTALQQDNLKSVWRFFCARSTATFHGLQSNWGKCLGRWMRTSLWSMPSCSRSIPFLPAEWKTSQTQLTTEIRHFTSACKASKRCCQRTLLNRTHHSSWHEPQKINQSCRRIVSPQQHFWTFTSLLCNSGGHGFKQQEKF